MRRTGTLGKQIKQKHPKQWDITGLLRLAWCCVGCKSPRSKGIGNTTHRLAALAVVAAIADRLQMQRAALHFAEFSTGSGRALVISRNYDASPMMASFGRLQGTISKYARYFVKEGDQWRLKSAEDFKACSKKALPRQGDLELLAQTASIHYKSGASWIHRQFCLKPMFLPNARASALYAAVEQSVPGLQLPALLRMAQGMRTPAETRRLAPPALANTRSLSATQLPDHVW